MSEVKILGEGLPEISMSQSFKTEPPDEAEHSTSEYNNESHNSSDNSERNFETLMKSVDNVRYDDFDKNHELTMSDIEKEIIADEERLINTNKQVKVGNVSHYPCNMCDEVFTCFVDVKEHKKLHFIEKRTCAICGIVCRSIGKLEVHMNCHLGIKPCVCDQCGKSYSSSTQLRIHKRVHTDEKRYKCDQCEEAFRYNGTLKNHIRYSHTKIMENTCKVCSKYFESPEGLKKHSKVHSKQKKNIKCQLCGEIFKSEQLLSCHLKIHTELKFPCDVCKRIYPSLYRLKKHYGRAHIPNVCACNKVFYERAEFTKHNKEFHKSEEPTTCEHCNKTFDKPKNLTEHIRLQHKGNGKINKCKICEKEFINSSLLRNHVKIHVKCFKCEHCDKIFGSRYNLQIHLVVHTKERNHECETCGNKYGTKTALKNHQYIHLEERKYACQICSKTFKSNHKLYSHKFVHETEKKFECEICHAKFTIKQYLNFHMKKHSNVKPFECIPCQRRFKHKRSWLKHCLLQRHKNAVMTSKEQFKCDYCEVGLDTEDLLMQHMVEEHGKEMNKVKLELENSIPNYDDDIEEITEDNEDDSDDHGNDNETVKEIHGNDKSDVHGDDDGKVNFHLNIEEINIKTEIKVEPEEMCVASS